MLEVFIAGIRYTGIAYSYVEALQQMREKLERDHIQILCNGAALDIYPSPMALSMGYGEKAYKLYLGKPTRMKDLVDIFEYGASLEFCTVEEQNNYYDFWIRSLKRG